MTNKRIIHTETVEVQASPSFARDEGITPLGLYLALRQTIEHTHITTANANGASWQTEYKTTDVRYLVINDNDRECSFGGECFRVI